MAQLCRLTVIAAGRRRSGSASPWEQERALPPWEEGRAQRIWFVWWQKEAQAFPGVQDQASCLEEAGGGRGLFPAGLVPALPSVPVILPEAAVETDVGSLSARRKLL